MPHPDRLVAIVMLALLAAMTVTAFGYRAEARLMPLVIGVPAIVLAAVQCFRSGGRREPVGDAVERSSGAHAELAALGWLAAFCGLVVLGGVLVGGSVAVALTQRVWLRETWRTAIIGGALSAVLVVVVFERQFGIALFEGLLLERLR